MALLDLVPWWGWLVAAAPFVYLAFRFFGFNGAVAVLLGALGASVLAKARASGAKSERDKQRAADDHARDVIHQRKEDVRSIPDTQAGKAERDERFSRWEK